jgi:hypothetical protein
MTNLPQIYGAYAKRIRASLYLSEANENGTRGTLVKPTLVRGKAIVRCLTHRA